MRFNPIRIPELCDEHTAIHIHYAEDAVPELVHNFKQRDALVADITIPSDADGPDAIAETFSRELNFPYVTTNWNAVNDWATDEEFVGNPVASLIVVRNLAAMAQQRPEDQELPVKLWAIGPRGYQFEEQAFHVVLVGDDPVGIDIAEIFRSWVPIYRINPRMLANIGYGSNRIPVYDWRTGTPELVIE